MNKNLIAQLQAAKQQGYLQGVVDGKEFALSFLTVALNDLYSFGGDRIAKVNSKMQELWDKEFKDDAETGARHLVKRLNQIKGIQCGDDSHEE